VIAGLGRAGGDGSPPPKPRRLWKLLLLGFAACAAALTVVAVNGSRGPAPVPAVAPPRPAAPAPPPPAAWLGLDYNSSANAGRLNDFAVRGIVYDREGEVEVDAGETPENSPRFANGLAVSYGAQMIPDVVVDPASGPTGCEGDPNPSKLCLPTNETDIGRYVQGFIQTASSVLQTHPGKRVLFEPMNEPWDWASPPGTQSGSVAAAQYAALLAQLLPAAKASKIPLTDIYVPATGTLSDGTSWVSGLYKAQPCLKPGPTSCGPIAGWNIHPYGLPNSPTEGIGSVPGVRAGMLSGQNNLILSEIGFCATDVSGGKNCNENKADIVGTSSQTATWLSKTLEEAAHMHQAGWLTALLLWERAGSGWAMQNPDGSLTAQGRALDLFAASPAGR
jgi:hypothetical protein